MQNHNVLTQTLGATNQIEFFGSHSSEPIVANCIGSQFKSIKLSGVGLLKCDHDADNCVFLKDMSVVVIADFVKCTNFVVAVGKKYECQRDVYSYPCQSSVIGEFLVSSPSGFLCWNINDILYKAVRLPTSPTLDSFVVFPLKRK